MVHIYLHARNIISLTIPTNMYTQSHISNYLSSLPNNHIHSFVSIRDERWRPYPPTQQTQYNTAQRTKLWNIHEKKKSVQQHLTGKKWSVKGNTITNICTEGSMYNLRSLFLFSSFFYRRNVTYIFPRFWLQLFPKSRGVFGHTSKNILVFSTAKILMHTHRQYTVYIPSLLYILLMMIFAISIEGDNICTLCQIGAEIYLTHSSPLSSFFHHLHFLSAFS